MDKTKYQIPPEPIYSMVNAAPTPGVALSPNKQFLVLLHSDGFPSIATLAQPELRLAGVRFSPLTSGPSRNVYVRSVEILELSTGRTTKVTGSPEGAQMDSFTWSPNGEYLGFTHTSSEGIQLWYIELKTAKARKASDAYLNAVLDDRPYRWLPNSQGFIIKANKREGSPPKQPLAPQGPIVQETSGKVSAIRTYQDLLKSPYDAELFEYYTQSQLEWVTLDGQSASLAESGIISDFSIAPGGEYVLIRYKVRPFSYAVPVSHFGSKLLLLNLNDLSTRYLAEIPVIEDLPPGFGVVAPGPRSFEWRADVPAQLYWVEALDGGDPAVDVEFRDRIYCLNPPFDDSPRQCMDLRLRFGGFSWGTGELALAHSWWWSDRRELTEIWKPDQPEALRTLIFDRNWEDQYNDPGNFLTKANQWGRQVLIQEGELLFLSGSGASPEGNVPFLDEFDLGTHERKRIWHSKSPYYEKLITPIHLHERRLLIRRESTETPPNYYEYHIPSAQQKALTSFEHPYPEFKGVRKESVLYKREDGVDLSGTLYLPSTFQAGTDEPLPALMWAYPKEFKHVDTASQRTDSPYEFPRLYWGSPVYWATKGYAVFDDFSVPIVAGQSGEPNEAFVDQLVASASAAIDMLVNMGVADPNKIAVGGHSYGAFMTVNLLAHSSLFAAGIARSGAYNRTLTPFGFQNEERTLWKAREVYLQMSPFLYSDQIQQPLLLIHGEADNNPGTFTMQSERLFAAMKAHAKPCRLVLLPHESHGYLAKESIMHMLWEQDQWLEKYVRNATVSKPTAVQIPDSNS